MGHIHDHEPRQGPDLARGEGPGHCRAPVVGHQHHLRRAGGVNEGGDILQQPLHPVAVHIPGLGLGLPIATQVRRPDPVAEFGQHRHLGAPGEAALWKPVQAQGETVAFADLVHREGETIGLNDSRGHRHVPL